MLRFLTVNPVMDYNGKAFTLSFDNFVGIPYKECIQLTPYNIKGYREQILKQPTIIAENIPSFSPLSFPDI
jgi:hypothetical protein